MNQAFTSLDRHVPGPRFRPAVAALLALAGLTAASCGAGPDTPREASSSQAGPSQPSLTDSQRLLDLPPEDLDRLLGMPPGPGRVRLVNVWATWCAPCIKEFPYLVQLARTYPEKLDVVFISADFPEDRPRALDFLTQQGVDWPSYLKTGRDEAFIGALSDDWSGAIPFTLVQREDGTVSAEWSGEADLSRFEAEVLEAGLNPPSDAPPMR